MSILDQRWCPYCQKSKMRSTTLDGSRVVYFCGTTEFITIDSFGPSIDVQRSTICMNRYLEAESSSISLPDSLGKPPRSSKRSADAAAKAVAMHS